LLTYLWESQDHAHCWGLGGCLGSKRRRDPRLDSEAGGGEAGAEPARVAGAGGPCRRHGQIPGAHRPNRPNHSQTRAGKHVQLKHPWQSLPHPPTPPIHPLSPQPTHRTHARTSMGEMRAEVWGGGNRPSMSLRNFHGAIIHPWKC